MSPLARSRRFLALLATIVGAAAVAFVAPFFLGEYYVLVLFQVFELAALAQAWNLLAGYGGLISMAPAASVGLGMYGAAVAGIHLGLPLPLLVIVGGLSAAAFALVVSVPMFRFRGLYFTIATLVLAQALGLFMVNWNGLGGTMGLFLTKYAPSSRSLYYYSLVIAVLVTVIVVVVLRTPLGLSLRALRDDEDTAQETGVSTFRTKLWVFVLSSFLMGLVGGLQAARLGTIEPYGAFSLTWTVNAITTSILGGVGTIIGPLFGAGVVVVIGEALARYTEIHVAIIGAIVILMIRFAPGGICGVAGSAWRRAALRWGSPADKVMREPRAPGVVADEEPSPDCAGAALVLSPGSGGVLLRAHGLTKRFGDVLAVDKVNIELVDGEILGIIGPNGAGKTTVVGMLSGALSVDEGEVEFDGLDVTNVPAYRRARLGIGRTHQIPRPFGQMTVLENLLVARSYGGRSLSGGDLRSDCRAILEEVDLLPLAASLASDLTLLQLKRLELARALALEPKVLLLDEIGAGLVESELQDLTALICRLRGRVRAMVMIEHIMDVIKGCCDRVMVLDWGKMIASGGVTEVLESPEVVSCYLGSGRMKTEVSFPEPSTAGEGPPQLSVDGVSASYGHFRALTNVSFSIRAGEVVTLLGTNGSGKTTVARVVSGMLRPGEGHIAFGGSEITGRPPHIIARLGLAHCMEGRHIFGDLTVEQNLILAGSSAGGTAEVRERRDRVYDLFDILAERRKKSGHQLSGGQQQMLAIGRALMADPKLIIFDEISLGLAPTTVDRLYDTLASIREQGTAMLVIEQNVERGLALADRALVMQKGTVAWSGSRDAALESSLLRSLYLGHVSADTSAAQPSLEAETP
jgi:branched-chain amino acid transport system ATP-binding protein